MHELGAKERELAFLARSVGQLVTGRKAAPEGDMESLDWSWIVSFARAQRLFGFLAHALRESGEATRLPRVMQVLLKGEVARSRGENEAKRGYFAGLSARLVAESVRVMPLKGTSLSYFVYEAAPLRLMSDTDVVVHPDDAQRTFELLAAWGVEPDVPPLPNRWHSEIHWQFGTHGRRTYRDGGASLDLHWDPLYVVEGESVRFDWNAIWERARAADGVTVMHPHDELTFVLVHAIERSGPVLGQLLDLAMLGARYPGASFVDGATRIARREYVARLARALLDTSVALFDPAGASRGTMDAALRFLTPCPDRRGVPWTDVPRVAMPRFLAGYLVPDLGYYGRRGIVDAYAKHVRHLTVRTFDHLGELARNGRRIARAARGAPKA